MSTLSTHILDTAIGKPAVGVAIRLEQLQSGKWVTLTQGETDTDGRLKNLGDGELGPGQYRLVAQTGEYFAITQRETLYPVAQIDLILPSDNLHYHLPFLISPWSWSTYRGS